MVRVAHLGEGAFLNDHPLFVLVRDSMSAARHGGVPFRRTPPPPLLPQPSPQQQQSGQALQDAGREAMPSGMAQGSQEAGQHGMVMRSREDKSSCAAVAGSSVALVPSAAFLRSWNQHTTLHLRRWLHAPHGASSDEDSDSELSSDISCSGSDKELERGLDTAHEAELSSAAERGKCTNDEKQMSKGPEDAAPKAKEPVASRDARTTKKPRIGVGK